MLALLLTLGAPGVVSQLVGSVGFVGSISSMGCVAYSIFVLFFLRYITTLNVYYYILALILAATTAKSRPPQLSLSAIVSSLEEIGARVVCTLPVSHVASCHL